MAEWHDRRTGKVEDLAAQAKADAEADSLGEFGRSHPQGKFSFEGDMVEVPEHHTRRAYVKQCPACRSDAEAGNHPRKNNK
jgi:hypothetical protein